MLRMMRVLSIPARLEFRGLPFSSGPGGKRGSCARCWVVAAAVVAILLTVWIATGGLLHGSVEVPLLRCATAPEKGVLTVGCPQDTVISRVTFASYGNPAGGCGSGTFAPGSCHLLTSVSEVEAECVGLASCTLLAAPAATLSSGQKRAGSHAGFSIDPCPGRPRWLAVAIECGVGSDFNVDPKFAERTERFWPLAAEQVRASPHLAMLGWLSPYHKAGLLFALFVPHDGLLLGMFWPQGLCFSAVVHSLLVPSASSGQCLLSAVRC